MIEDSLKNRAHVVDYDPDVIPTAEEVKEILQTGYSLVTSKQKGYPYQCYVLGPNSRRSHLIWRLAEGDKIRIDEEALGPSDDRYRENPGLFHMRSAPWTLIFTPRVAPANPFHRRAFDSTNSKWQLDDADYVDFSGQRESTAIEVGMLAKTITGAAMDRGWECSYNICFPGRVEEWSAFPFINFAPFLIQTIGKGKKYKWETLTPEESVMDTDPPFETIFNFVDKG